MYKRQMTPLRAIATSGVVSVALCLSACGGSSSGEKTVHVSAGASSAKSAMASAASSASSTVSSTSSASSESSSTDGGSSDSSSSSGGAGGSGKVGQPVSAGQWDVTVNSSQDPYKSTNDFETPEAGKRYVLVNVTVLNKSSKQQTMSSMMNFDLRDSDSEKFSSTIVTSADPVLDGDVPANGKLKGNLVFEVPSSAHGLILFFHSDLFEGTDVQIPLGK